MSSCTNMVWMIMSPPLSVFSLLKRGSVFFPVLGNHSLGSLVAKFMHHYERSLCVFTQYPALITSPLTVNQRATPLMVNQRAAGAGTDGFWLNPLCSSITSVPLCTLVSGKQCAVDRHKYQLMR